MEAGLVRIVTMLVVALAAQTAAAASEDDRRESAFRGKRIAEANCATCHAIAQLDASPLPAAPPLREIGRTIPAERLRELLRGAVFADHAVMPDFEPDEEQADDIANYIRSIAEDR